MHPKQARFLVDFTAVERVKKPQPYVERKRQCDGDNIEHTVPVKLNWLPANELIENQRKCTVASCLKS